ncbi:hypothetical protein [Gordonibacter pamelaeae]|uniref:hypothetical protein n=1 Tax=Gordonibacter pamelaeae TaxID=471189 RepID=UPI003A8ED0ED
MKPNERLAVLTAVSKIVKAELDAARAEVEAGMSEAFEENGTDRARLMLGGTEVGSVTLKVDRTGWEVEDPEEFSRFLADNGQLKTVRRLRPEYQGMAWSMLGEEYPFMFDVEETPEPSFLKAFERIDGAVVVGGTDVAVPGVRLCPPKPKGLMVTGCKPKLVGPIAARLGGLDALLLPEGGEA